MEEQTLLTSPWRSQRGALPQLVHPVVFTLMQHSAVDGHATLGCVTIARHGDITIRPYGVSNPKPSGPMASMIGSRLLSVTGSTHGFCPSSLPTSNARKVATESLCSGIREPQFRSSEHASSAISARQRSRRSRSAPFSRDGSVLIQRKTGTRLRRRTLRCRSWGAPARPRRGRETPAGRSAVDPRRRGLPLPS